LLRYTFHVTSYINLETSFFYICSIYHHLSIIAYITFFRMIPMEQQRTEIYVLHFDPYKNATSVFILTPENVDWFLPRDATHSMVCLWRRGTVIT